MEIARGCFMVSDRNKVRDGRPEECGRESGDKLLSATTASAPMPPGEGQEGKPWAFLSPDNGGGAPALHSAEFNLTCLSISFDNFPRGEQPKFVVDRSFAKLSRKRNAYRPEMLQKKQAFPCIYPSKMLVHKQDLCWILKNIGNGTKQDVVRHERQKQNTG